MLILLQSINIIYIIIIYGSKDILKWVLWVKVGVLWVKGGHRVTYDPYDP